MIYEKILHHVRMIVADGEWKYDFDGYHEFFWFEYYDSFDKPLLTYMTDCDQMMCYDKFKDKVLVTTGIHFNSISKIIARTLSEIFEIKISHLDDHYVE